MDPKTVMIIGHPNQSEFIAYAREQGYNVIVQNELSTGIRGTGADFIVVDDDFSDIEQRIIALLSSGVRRSAKLNMIGDILDSWLKIVSVPEPYPQPKPVKTRLKIKQAPQQPFRLSMRSVNRNR